MKTEDNYIYVGRISFAERPQLDSLSYMKGVAVGNLDTKSGHGIWQYHGKLYVQSKEHLKALTLLYHCEISSDFTLYEKQEKE